MNTGAFGENFPYSNFHDLNMDWIIKIAKDFLDQYTHIQQVITDGETSLQNLTTDGLQQLQNSTTEGLQQLQDKATALEALLQAWYEEHSEDIADQLADALQDLNDWYTQHQNYLDNILQTNIDTFDAHAESKASTTIASIPEDYTELTNIVATLSRNIVGTGLILDSVTLDAYIRASDNAIRTGYPEYRISNYIAIENTSVRITGEVHGWSLLAISVWDGTLTTLVDTVLSVNTGGQILVDKTVSLTAGQALRIVDFNDHPLSIIGNGNSSYFNTMFFDKANEMFNSPLTLIKTIKNAYIRSSDNAIIQNFPEFNIRYYTTETDANVILDGYTTGSYVLSVSIWNDAISTCERQIYITSGATWKHYRESIIVPANKVLAICDMTAQPMTISNYLESRYSDILRGSGFENEITVSGLRLFKTYSQSYLRSTDKHIIHNYPEFRIRYFYAESEAKVIVSGYTTGSYILTVSIWDASLEICEKEIYITTGATWKYYEEYITIPANKVLCISDMTEQPMIISNQTHSMFTHLLQGANEVQPTIYPTTGAVSGSPSNPDFSDLTQVTYNAVGDSITAGDYYRTNVYRAFRCYVRNCGLGASTIAINNTYLQNQSIVERVCGLNGNTPYDDAEIWTIMGGVNDQLYASPIGTPDSEDNTTIYGALKSICKYIRQRPNNPLLILCTPLQSNRDGEYMRQLVIAIKYVAKMFACPVIDLYNESGICHSNLNTALTDGVHPSTYGSYMLSRTIINGIQREIPYYNP